MVYYRIFWIRGKTLRIQSKNRGKIISEKTKADLKKAIEEFTVSYLETGSNIDTKVKSLLVSSYFKSGRCRWMV